MVIFWRWLTIFASVCEAFGASWGCRRGRRHGRINKNAVGKKTLAVFLFAVGVVSGDVFINGGYFSKEELNINGKKIKPIDLTARLLFPMWEMKEDDEEFTLMRIKISGLEKGIKVTYTYCLLDRFQDKTMSMARTTGYTCTAAVNLLAEGIYTKKGISPASYCKSPSSVTTNTPEEKSKPTAKASHCP